MYYVQYCLAVHRLEECVKELWQEAHHVQPSRKFATPMEACDALFEDRLLDKKTCYDTDTKAVTRLLRFVVSVLPLLVSSCNHEVPVCIMNTKYLEFTFCAYI